MLLQVAATPEVIGLSPEQLDSLLTQLRAHLPPALFELVAAALRTLRWVLEVLQLIGIKTKREGKTTLRVDIEQQDFLGR